MTFDYEILNAGNRLQIHHIAQVERGEGIVSNIQSNDICKQFDTRQVLDALAGQIETGDAGLLLVRKDAIVVPVVVIDLKL